MNDSPKFEGRINAVERALAASRKQQAKFDHVKQASANFRAQTQPSLGTAQETGNVPVSDKNMSPAEATFALLNQAVKTSIETSASRAHHMRIASDAFDAGIKTTHADAADTARVVEGEVVLDAVPVK